MTRPLDVLVIESRAGAAALGRDLSSPISHGRIQELAVRVHDAVRTCGQTYGHLDVWVAGGAVAR